MTKKESTAVTTLVEGVQQEIPEWLQKGNAGSEEVTAKDMILPRVDVLQALSPQIKKSDPAYIEGAEQGQIFNTVTGRIYGPSIMFIPVMFRKEFVLWKLRKAGGGFIGAFKDLPEANTVLASMPNPADFEVVESHQHFCLILDPDGIEEAVFSMTKSKLKTSRALNTLIQIAGVDRFAKAYRIYAVEESGDKGDYWGFKVHQVGFVNKELYERARGLYELIKAGAADVDRSDRDTNGPAPAAEL
jgi:hypothetical protein